MIGTGKKLKKWNKNIDIIALEPDKMPIISQNKILGSHKIEGIGDEFIPELLDKNFIDNVILVNDDDAINMSKLLAKKLGLGVGISSGANILACILYQEQTNLPVVTVFPDDNKKYLSTSLCEPIVTNNNFISNKIELLDYEVL